MQVKEGLQQPKRGLIILGYLHALASVSLSCTFSLLGAASGTAKGNLIRWEHQYVGWVWMREMIQDCSAGEFKICVIPPSSDPQEGKRQQYAWCSQQLHSDSSYHSRYLSGFYPHYSGA